MERLLESRNITINLEDYRIGSMRYKYRYKENIDEVKLTVERFRSNF